LRLEQRGEAVAQDRVIVRKQAMFREAEDAIDQERDGGAVHDIATAVVRTIAYAVEQAGPDKFVPELVSLLQQRGPDAGCVKSA
jgi:hypothetical protein